MIGTSTAHYQMANGIITCSHSVLEGFAHSLQRVIMVTKTMGIRAGYVRGKALMRESSVERGAQSRRVCHRKSRIRFRESHREPSTDKCKFGLEGFHVRVGVTPYKDVGSRYSWPSTHSSQGAYCPHKCIKF